jgi:hypothetical protein
MRFPQPRSPPPPHPPLQCRPRSFSCPSWSPAFSETGATSPNSLGYVPLHVRGEQPAAPCQCVSLPLVCAHDCPRRFHRGMACGLPASSLWPRAPCWTRSVLTVRDAGAGCRPCNSYPRALPLPAPVNLPALCCPVHMPQLPSPWTRFRASPGRNPWSSPATTFSECPLNY